MLNEDVLHQYQGTDLLAIRTLTHKHYSEVNTDLDAECARALRLSGDESLLDVGCGPGVFLRYLRSHGHTGRLAGLDQSAGMIAAASAASDADGQAIEWFTGLAGALPFGDGEFAVVSARHMLYHVPDILATLREFARVVGPGGVVFAATNFADTTPHCGALEDDLAAEFGITATPSSNAKFNHTNAPDLLAQVFTEVEETLLPSALVFTEAAPVVRYVMTMSTPQQLTQDPDQSARVHDWLTAEAERRLAAMGGVWRDPKGIALYRCVAG